MRVIDSGLPKPRIAIELVGKEIADLKWLLESITGGWYDDAIKMTLVHPLAAQLQRVCARYEDVLPKPGSLNDMYIENNMRVMHPDRVPRAQPAQPPVNRFVIAERDAQGGIGGAGGMAIEPADNNAPRRAAEVVRDVVVPKPPVKPNPLFALPEEDDDF